MYKLLKSNSVKLESLTDIVMVLLVEPRIRGGITQAPLRHAISKNKYVKYYDPSKEISYPDAISLCGWPLVQGLPTGWFEWLDNTNNFELLLKCGDLTKFTIPTKKVVFLR